MEEHAEPLIEAQEPLLGRVFEGRYRVIRVLGRGGMGVVYLAEHVRLRRKVAIKMLHPQLTGSQELVQRFHREARAAAVVGNEHVVDVTDMGQLEDGSYYLVLEYLEGTDLGALVEAHGRLEVSRAAFIVSQICDALVAVHAAGIVHRDLKPENIFLVSRGGTRDFVKILDFGICKFHEDRPLTATGIALGTPRFMAPEQLEARRDVDQRADVYAAGAILYFALTGQGPFEAESLPHLLMSVWRDPAPRLSAVCPDAPTGLELIVSRALEKQPRDRFADAAELLYALAPFLAVAPESNIPRESPAEKTWAIESGIRESVALSTVLPSWRRRRRLHLIGASVMLLIGCVLLSAYLWTLPSVPHAMPAPHASEPAWHAPNLSPVEVQPPEASPPSAAADGAPDLVPPRRARRPKPAHQSARAAAEAEANAIVAVPEAVTPSLPAQPPAEFREPDSQSVAPPALPQPGLQRGDVPLPRELKHVFER